MAEGSSGPEEARPPQEVNNPQGASNEQTPPKLKSLPQEFGVSSVRDVLGLMKKDKELEEGDQGEINAEEFFKRMKEAEEMKQKLTGTENTTGQTPPSSPSQGSNK